MVHVFVIATLLSAVAEHPLTDATDVRAVLRGAPAVGIDPAGAASVDGAELSFRSRVVEPASSRQWGLYGVYPVGSLSLQVGYEWLQTDVAYRRGTLGVGYDLGHSLELGIGYHYLTRAGASACAWDASLLAAPASWLSLALGIEQFNQPRFAGEQLSAATWMGVGLRPVLGAPWLTFGAEAYIRLERDKHVLTTPRLVADIAPLSGLHAQVAYAPDARELWLGVGVALANVDIQSRVGVGVRGNDQRAQVASAINWRSNPSETLAIINAERTVSVPLSGKLTQPGSWFVPGAVVSNVVLQLGRLATDSSVATVILDIGTLDIGAADVDELRAAIYELRAAGKHVIAELVSGAEKEYLVAAAAERIRLDPAGSLTLNGYAVTLFYFANALAKIGVRFDAVAIGRYKTGPDTLVRANAQPVEKEMMDRILSRLFRTFVGSLVNDRHLDMTAVDEVLDRGVLSPAQALRLGLVDELSQPTDPSRLPIMREGGESLDLDDNPPSQQWSTRPVVLVIPVVGNITASGAAGLLPGGAADATSLVQELEHARLDANVRAVVLRIDSPGGEVYAAELIWRAVRLLAATKPVVVSMGNVAASGGYYIAAPAQLILAEPTTITGSIGIYMVKPDLSGLLTLTGVHTETRQAGPHANAASLYSPMSKDDSAAMHELLASEYETFLGRVADGRKLPMAHVRAIAEGNVYTGEQALELGLVDGVGGLAQAVAEARSRAGLDSDREVEVRIVKATAPLGQMLGVLGSVTKVAPTPLTDILTKLQALAREPLARLPFEVMVTP